MSDRPINKVTIVCLDGVGKLEPNRLRQVIKEVTTWIQDPDNRLYKYRSIDGRYIGSFAGRDQFNLMRAPRARTPRKGRN